MEKTWYLKRINVFKGMSDAEVKHLDEITFMKHYDKKDLIYLPGDVSDQVYLLKEGRVKISKLSEDGREITLVILEPGEIFGESALIDDKETRSTVAEALENAYLCVISRRDFEEFINNKPELALSVTKLIGFRRRQIENMLEDLVFRGVHERLALLLLRLAERHGKEVDGKNLIDISLTHYDYANLIGSTRETTTACLNDFKREGLIEFQKRKVVIIDEKGLRNRAALED
ncbi:MAG: Crp/Fnr family transcriptional regulator [Candidatus Marinimicrobia bacterium]|nr:Crp/Fnr family transcriptional regulator [Candidatus Neomarinimicrobiota bacterium]